MTDNSSSNTVEKAFSKVLGKGGEDDLVFLTTLNLLRESNCDAITTVLSRAYTGTATTPGEPVFEWFLYPLLPTLEEDADERRKMAEFYIRLAVDDHAKTPLQANSTYFLGIRDPQEARNDEADKDDDASPLVFQGGTLLRVLDPSKNKRNLFQSIWHVMANDIGSKLWLVAHLWRTGQIPSAFHKISSWKRLVDTVDSLKKQLEHAHEACFPNQERHLYLAEVGVDPSHQGKGIAKRLLTCVNALGDELGIPCYLECNGAKLKAVYEKSGYRVVRQEVVLRPGTQKEEDETEDDSNNAKINKEENPHDKLELYLMVRPPQ